MRIQYIIFPILGILSCVKGGKDIVVPGQNIELCLLNHKNGCEILLRPCYEIQYVDTIRVEHDSEIYTYKDDPSPRLSIFLPGGDSLVLNKNVNSIISYTNHYYRMGERKSETIKLPHEMDQESEIEQGAEIWIWSNKIDYRERIPGYAETIYQRNNWLNQFGHERKLKDQVDATRFTLLLYENQDRCWLVCRYKEPRRREEIFVWNKMLDDLGVQFIESQTGWLYDPWHEIKHVGDKPDRPCSFYQLYKDYECQSLVDMSKKSEDPNWHPEILSAFRIYGHKITCYVNR